MVKNQADKWLLGAVFGLLVFGLIMITSIGVPKSIQLSAPQILYPNCSDPQVDCYLLLKNHASRMLIGILGLILISKIPYRFWKKSALFWYITTVILLTIVLIFGSQYTTFARSWIVLFNTSLQPVEFSKLALIFYLAHWMERKNKEIETFQFGFLPFCIVSGIILLPILLQPDLGGLSVVTAVAVSMYYVAGARLKHLALGGIVIILGALLAMSTVSHVSNRIQAFLNQNSSCREDYCWQTEQANIAVGSGGFWGKGLTQGVQKSYWLPQATDDFIFAASAEELGFIRTLFVVIAYGIIAWRGYTIASNSPDRFTMLTAVGITTWIVFQALLNICINIGLFPVTGITLPFVSYGGSSLLATLIASGVLLHISKYATQNTSGAGRRGDRRTYNAKHSYY